jgi:pimeloyl-ACP methyl ester carboxylesterase
VSAAPVTSGYVPANGLRLYYETHGAGEPLIVLHGAMRTAAFLGDLVSRLAERRQVIAVDLQAHGRTADADRPLRFELMADDIAALVAHLGLGRADVMGYSLGGAVALRTAIQHPGAVRKLVLVSAAFAQNNWYPEIVAALGQLNGTLVEYMRGSPEYQTYVTIAPDPEGFPKLLDKLGELLGRDYDWSESVAALAAPVMLVYADHDGVPPSQIARFFELLGGGKRDPGFDGSGMSRARLAILPGLTHYNVFAAPPLVDLVEPFLSAPS